MKRLIITCLDGILLCNVQVQVSGGDFELNLFSSPVITPIINISLVDPPDEVKELPTYASLVGEGGR